MTEFEQWYTKEFFGEEVEVPSWLEEKMGVSRYQCKRAWNAALEELEKAVYNNEEISDYTKEFIDKLKT